MKLRTVQQFVAGLMVMLLMLSVFGYGVPVTAAYYSDAANSITNAFNAGTLDLQLTASASWSAVTAGASSADFFPGDVVTRGVRVENVGTLDFDYTASISHTTLGAPDLCPLLDLVATRTPLSGAPAVAYTGPLLGFTTTPFNLATSSSDHWQFDVSLPVSEPEQNNDLSCRVALNFNGFILPLTFGQGFYDQEIINDPANLFGSGGWVIPNNNYSPVADARIRENQPGTNFGNAPTLLVRNQTGNRRDSLLRFDLNLPSTATINSASLELFMFNAPSADRVYNVHRVDVPWTESGVGGVTWTASPSAEFAPTDATNTGTTDGVWLNWNVKTDVQGFTAGSFPNNGWKVTDASGTPSTAEGQFRSRESGVLFNQQRPVLEVNFTAPPAPTNHLVVNEVHFNTASGSDNANEWVELYNPTTSAVDLTGWKICDSSASCDIFPGTPSIPAKGFAVVANNASTWNTFWTQIIATGATTIALGSPIGNQLANGGDSVVLEDPSSTVVDKMSYGSVITGLNPSVPLSGRGDSLARVVKGYDTDSANDWLINATPNPGTNPSASGSEVMRVTTDGIMVADAAVGLNPLMAEEKLDDEEILVNDDPLISSTSIDFEPIVMGSASVDFTPAPAPAPEPMVTPDPTATPTPTPEPTDTLPTTEGVGTPTDNVGADPSVTPTPDTTPTPTMEPDPSVTPAPEPFPSTESEPEIKPELVVPDISIAPEPPTSAPVEAPVVPPADPAPASE